MKNGLFKALSLFLLVLGTLQLSGCASFFELGEEEDPYSFDRGYQSSDEECTGRFCDTEAEASSESDDGDVFRRSVASRNDGESSRIRRAIETRDIILGMTRQDVMDSWGEPVQREVAGNGDGGHERWTYGSRLNFNGSRTVIFEGGRVAGWRR